MVTTCVGSEPVLISGATTATFTPFARRYVTRLRVVLETPLTGPKDSVARRSFFPFRMEGKERELGESSPCETSILRCRCLTVVQTCTVIYQQNMQEMPLMDTTIRGSSSGAGPGINLIWPAA